jgi:hypothetical protein
MTTIVSWSEKTVNSTKEKIIFILFIFLFILCESLKMKRFDYWHSVRKIAFGQGGLVLSCRCARDCSGKPAGFASANPRTWNGKPGFFARGGRAKKCARRRSLSDKYGL